MDNNPLLCNPDTGLCAIPERGVPASTEAAATASNSREKPIQITYFTDPICSSCWGIEPQLRRLKLEYGAYLHIDYRMGGLLPDWSYNSGGISKPSDVAGHWDEVSHHYDMPIDGDVWLEDPLPSSYPPSIAFKAAQMQVPVVISRSGTTEMAVDVAQRYRVCTIGRALNRRFLCYTHPWRIEFSAEPQTPASPSLESLR